MTKKPFSTKILGACWGLTPRSVQRWNAHASPPPLGDWWEMPSWRRTLAHEVERKLGTEFRANIRAAAELRAKPNPGTVGMFVWLASATAAAEAGERVSLPKGVAAWIRAITEGKAVAPQVKPRPAGETLEDCASFAEQVEHMQNRPLALADLEELPGLLIRFATAAT
jgi:hypothetical protein